MGLLTARALLETDPRAAVICHDLGPEELRSLRLPEGCRIVAVCEAGNAVTEATAFVLAVRDRRGLRHVVGALPDLGKARTIACCFTEPAGHPPVLIPRPEWPHLLSLTTENETPAWTTVRFQQPVAVRHVLTELSRCSVSGRPRSAGWPLIAVACDDRNVWPPGDPTAAIFRDKVAVSAVHGAPDVIAGSTSRLERLPQDTDPHPITGRAPVRVDIGPELSWEDIAQRGYAGAPTALEEDGRLALGAVDDRVINPIGFRRRHSDAVARMLPVEERSELLTLTCEGSTHTIDSRRGLGETDVAFLRDAKAVALDWTGGWGPQAYCRVVAGLAMAGIPLTVAEPPQWAEHLLGDRLLATLATSPDLDDPLAREEFSIELRRAALTEHSSGAWRRALARRAGAQVAPTPRVSVLLCTRRPQQLVFAVRQVTRQVGVDIELVIATHGFDLTDDELSAVTPPELPTTALSVPAELPFGDALNLAAERASGDVFVKMDDDDWYGTDFIADLVLARTYSGADVVGCPPEFIFLEQLWLTTRGKAPTEVYHQVVAGGTIMVDRAVFQGVGGFRSMHRHVDASLLRAVADSGGTTYRSHGLGYVLRRGPAGHTWDPGNGYFLARSRVAQQWRGFRPSRLLALDQADAPKRGAREF